MKLLGALALAALTVVASAESIVLSKNYLLNNPNWIVGKQMSLVPMTGASQTVTSRSVLAGYEMNFASYGANQELISRRPENIDRIDLRLHLSAGAIFDIFYSESAGERSGLRISNNRAFPGRIFRLKDYQFSWSELQPTLEIAPGWHEISIRPQAGEMWIFIDGRPLLALPESQLSPSFGFRSGKEKVVLTRVETYLGGIPVWEDTFRMGHLWRDSALRAAFILGIALLAALVAFRRWGKVVTLLRYSAAISVLWFAFDYFYYSFLPTTRTRAGSELVHPTISYFNFEDLRTRVFETLLTFPGDGQLTLLGEPPYPPQIIDLHPLVCVNNDCTTGEEGIRFPPKAPQEKRLLMLGGSMLRGQGVMKAENIFFNKLAQQARELLRASHFTALNLARSNEVEDQLSLFLGNYQDFQPDIVVASFLGSWRESQERALRQLAEYCRDHQILLIYMVAPMNLEYGEGPTSGLELLEKTYGTIGLDLKRAFASELRENTGIIWWDGTHLTDYGNRQLFEYSRPFIERHLAPLSDQGNAAHEEARPD